MATLLYRLGRFAFRRRRLVALVWAVLLAAAAAAAFLAPPAASGQFSIPGTQAQQAFDLLDRRFPGSNADGATARVVFQARGDRKITDPAARAEVHKALAELQALPKVQAVTDPYRAKAISPDASIAYIQVSYRVPSIELSEADRDALQEAVHKARGGGLTVEVGGDALSAAPEGGATEAIGVAVAAVVLLVTFGSLIAAGLPLLTALVGIGVAVAAVTALSAPLELDDTTPILATMIGLAVGIDYALFIVSRHRAELAEGRDAAEAAGRATGTAGSAVVFAGLTVVIALAGLAVVGIPLLTKMGLAAAAAVVVAVLVALTLIPALLGFAGDKVLPRSRRAKGARPEGGGLGARWARLVLRFPVPVLLVTVAALGVIAIPAADMRLGLPDDGSQPVSTTQRRAYDLLSKGFGPGFNGPLVTVVDAAGAKDPQGAAARVAQQISGMPNVAAVLPPAFNRAGDTAMITVIPASGPADDRTEKLVRAIRGTAAEVKAATGARVLVTGQTAVAIDMSQKLDDALIPYLALVVGLAFLLLILVFRSLLVPLKAALGFLLSVLASLGAVVAVFQWGWLKDPLGVEVTGPVMSMMPIFLVGVVFGLAMDYEVFLVTRIREACVHGEDARQAVVTGFAHSARVVTAAAIIMISVFAGFIGFSDPMVKMIGFGLAIAVLFDAFAVRMTIVPAVLALLGKAAWWLPRRLDKVLPEVDVEGEKLNRPAPAAPQPQRELQVSGV